MEDLSFNQASEEVIELATSFVEKYTDYVENLPFDLQRNVTKLREIDCSCREIVAEMESLYSSFVNESEISLKRKSTLIKIQRLLGRCQELGDEKISIVQQISEAIENRKRIVEHTSYRFKSVYRPDKKNEFDGKRELNKSDCHKHSKRSRRRPHIAEKLHEKDKVIHMKTESASMQTTKSSVNIFTSSDKQSPSSLMDTSSNSVNNVSKVKEEISSNRKNDKQEKKDPNPTSSASNGSAGSALTSSSVSSRTSSSLPSSSSKMTLAKSSISSKTNVNVQTPNGSNKNSVKGKKKKKKSIKYHNDRAATRSPSPQVDIPIDPDEPTYCLCDQVSFGQMIGCDNKKCPIEWFHFSCVGLSHKPKGKWYCPDCIRDMKDRKKESKR